MTRERKPTYAELEQRLAVAEKALRENEWRDRQLIDTLNEGIWRIDEEGRTTFVNPRMAEMLGYTAEEMQGEHLFAFMDKEWANEAGKNLKRREQGISEQHEFLFRKKSGETIYALLNTSPVLDQTGAYAGALAGVTDITIRRRAEQALRESEERLKLALHGADLGMWDWDLQTGGIAFNEQWAGMLGYGLDEIEPNLGTWENLVHPDDMPGVREVLNAHLQGKTDSYEAEFRMRHKSGEWVWILDKGRVIERDREGKPLRACGTHLDITSQRQAREKISRSEELFRKFFETSVNYCYMISPEGVILDVNPAALKALKYERDELLGQPLATIYAHESQARRMEIFEKWKRTGHIRNEEMIIQAKSGERRTVLLSAGNVLDPDGKPLHSVSVQTDITDRKLAEEALRRSEEKFRSITEQTSDVIALTDHQGIITYASQSCEQVFGSTPDEMTGRHFTEFLDKSVVSVAIKAFRESIQQGRRSKNLELLMKRKDGSRFYGELSGSFYSSEPILGTLVLIRDITDRKQAEEEKKRLEEQFRQAQKLESVGRLAGGVAHDFNNMLGVIIANAESAELEIRDGLPVRKNIQEILNASHRAAETVRQLLAFARKQIISPRILELDDIASESLTMLRRLVGEDITLRYVPGKNVGKVRMDTTQVHQILANLVVNSRDAMPKGGAITIETANQVVDETCSQRHNEFVPGDYVVLTVSDRGEGMSPEVLKRVFDPFFTTKEVGKGTGLGLPMVYGSVKQNDGFVYIYSEPGEGTTVKIYLPRCWEEPSAREKTVETKAPMGNETVLVAEDEEALLTACGTVLKRQGYKVLAASSAEEALTLAEQHNGEIHLLVTDVVMPGMNGRELWKSLWEERPSIKCLFMSGYTADVIAHHGVLGKDVHFIEKPFSLRGLAQKVRNILDNE